MEQEEYEQWQVDRAAAIAEEKMNVHQVLVERAEHALRSAIVDLVDLREGDDTADFVIDNLKHLKISLVCLQSLVDDIEVAVANSKTGKV